MNIRQLFIHALAAVLFGITASACAQTPVDPAQRQALLETLSRGPAFTSNNEQYQLLPGVRAARQTGSESQTLQSLGVPATALIERKGKFLMFQHAATGAAAGASLVRQDQHTLYPVALNPRTGQLGLMPGTISVMLKNPDAAAALAADHGVQLYRAFPQLKTAYYRVQPGQDILAAAAALAGDPRAASAEAEVVEYMRVPK
jgi:hypothetical protein